MCIMRGCLETVGFWPPLALRCGDVGVANGNRTIFGVVNRIDLRPNEPGLGSAYCAAHREMGWLPAVCAEKRPGGLVPAQVQILLPAFLFIVWNGDF